MATRKTSAPESKPQGDVPAADEAVLSETYTYPDGSAVRGRPPWPELSPIERNRAEAEGKAAA
ncbi:MULTISPECIES: hypothetical protein [unclassified Variovorax]|uniref:hypothetical protein n=1 Tax=unclassified Variovorax TaxID=663243 RepID=UPI00076CBAEE|nr:MULTISPECIES: hypothetical protein [unclassified Variovorax]KWT94674.1 hypothetical protein APY03_2549 [Variovorax sp. WDL1]PNG53187.1 hypothetical protein CHC06_04532 [Variovorax sp. B2]PNG53759.1 hypothetical protein CHC07_03579 [Variovorax sp. B4]VTV11212.1 hypothetical protein WDL1CHR_02093 [Variovorax sp. WDL1]